MTALFPEIPESLLARPLDYLLADHFRQRRVLSLLIQLADGRTAGRDAAVVAAGYLKTALPLHYADEEADLFPALRQRCLPEDGLEAILTRLHQEHIEGDACATALVQDLSAWPAHGERSSISPAVAARLRSFVELELLHLALENAVLIPLARTRLAPADLTYIADRMLLRRPNPGGA